MENKYNWFIKMDFGRFNLEQQKNKNKYNNQSQKINNQNKKIKNQKLNLKKL